MIHTKLLKTLTIADIRSWSPCYDPERYLPESWSGTVLDLLSLEDIPAEDRAWVVLREELVDEKILRLFAIWCGKQALKTIEKPDFRLMNACDVAEQFAMGEATEEELSEAWHDARDNAWVAAHDADRDAASIAFSDGAWAAWAAWSASDDASDAAWATASDTAWDAAWDAARAAARAAAWAAARDAGKDASDVIRDAAWVVAWDAQIEQLSKMIQKQNT